MTSHLTRWDMEPIIRDPDEEYRVLERSLRWVKGFSLYFVVCTPVEGERIITKIKDGIPQKKVEVLRLTEEISNLYRILDAIPDKDTLNILFIKGLEYSLNAYVKPGVGGQGDYYNLDSLPPLLGHLNLQRERFRDNFNFCLVFLLPKFAHKFLIRRAPDFYDWGSGYFEFPMNAELLKTETQPYQVERDFEEYENLTPQERHQKILEIEVLLDEPGLTPEIQADLLVEQGRLLWASQEYNQSYYNFDRAIAIHPNNYKAWVNRGIALDNLDRLEEAIASYDQVLTIKFDDYNVWCYRGNALYNLGRLEEAIASYDRILTIKPDNPQAWNNRGAALEDLGRFEDALASYNQAITLNPDKLLYRKNKERLLIQIQDFHTLKQTAENPSPENPLP